MNYRIWYSTESLADYFIDNTNLSYENCTKCKMYESDANNAKKFHTLPDHIKKILYLDAPDLIVELDRIPIFSVEISTEAWTWHNAFQRFARLAASVENNVPCFYIYPEAAIINRQKTSSKWDSLNPLVFKALEDVMNIYNIPALLYYFPTDYHKYNSNPISSPNFLKKGLIYESSTKYAGCPNSDDIEMKNLFSNINELLEVINSYWPIEAKSRMISLRTVIDKRHEMQKEYIKKGGNENMSPLTATIKIKTEILLTYLSKFENSDYSIWELLKSREYTILYKIDAKFRWDPYPWALSAIDYLICREGKTFEERKFNLVLVWGELNINENKINLKWSKSTIKDFIYDVQSCENKNLLTKDYNQLSNYEIPRYYMQVRYGSAYSKVKHIRVYSYFADAILFPDWALWRDA